MKYQVRVFQLTLYSIRTQTEVWYRHTRHLYSVFLFRVFQVSFDLLLSRGNYTTFPPEVKTFLRFFCLSFLREPQAVYSENVIATQLYKKQS